jgi:hypothetical protein
MSKVNVNRHPRDVDEAIRVRILVRAAAINTYTKLLSRLTTVAKDLEEGSTREAINCLGGLERRIYAIRSLLLLTL